MPCLKPLLLKRRGSHSANSNQYVGCGRCIPCRLDYSHQWATRCVHEAELHRFNHFVTLTFDDDHLPEDYSLCKDTAQKWLKRLRYYLDAPFRYFLAGEYGEQLGRPHYHALLFGADLRTWHTHQGKSFALPLAPIPGTELSRSSLLESSWPFGFSSVAEFNFQTAAYVARYCVKKYNGPAAADHYQGRLPEFALMSRNPGLGAEWIARFKSDVFPRDEVRINGHTRTPPRFYLSKLPPDEQDSIKSARSGTTRRALDFQQQEAREAVVLHHHHQRKKTL